MSSPYTVIHGRRSLQLSTHRVVIPADEVSDFFKASHCAQALNTLLQHERERIDTAFKEAYAQGFAQGQAAAEQAAQAQVTQAIAQLTLAAQAQQEQAREAVSTLALAVVHKLSSALGAYEIVPTLIEQSVRELFPEQPTRVWVSPGALASTKARLSHEVDVRADERLSAFDAVIDHAQGQSVVGLDAQLKAMHQALGIHTTLDVALA